MAWRWPWQKVEKRASASGFTAELMGLRSAYITGARGVAELTATVETCATLWARGLSIADVQGAPLLDKRVMAMVGRALALRGECVFFIAESALVPASDWDTSTRFGRPTAYRLSLPEVGGGTTRTVLAPEVLHFILDPDVTTPWAGTSPLRRARLTGDMLAALETALGEVYAQAPIGSVVLPFPEAPQTDMEALGRSFRGKRGGVLLRESVAVTAAGGATPQTDWKPSDLSPDIRGAMPIEALQSTRNSIMAVYGVLPCLLDRAGQGPAIREAERFLAQYHLQPTSELIALEASEKLGSQVEVDVLRPLQAFDQGGSARAFATLVQALAAAKEAGLEPAAVAGAFRRIDWET